MGGLLCVVNHSSGDAACPYYDGNGNVMGYVDMGGGSSVAEFEYGPFGETIRASGSMADLLAIRFSTKFTDEETGLLYYGFRYYDAETGRWLSRDSLGEEGGLNLYGFVNNDPISFLDILGLRVEIWSHSVGLASSGSSSGGTGGTGFQHASLRIFPDNINAFNTAHPNVVLFTDGNGEKYFVLSAGPQNGLLVSDQNRHSDLAHNRNTKRAIIAAPAGQSDIAFITSLLDADGRYADNLDYDFCPPLQNSHNSNSYVSGILKAVGAHVPNLSGVQYPGINQPVPSANF